MKRIKERDMKIEKRPPNVSFYFSFSLFEI
jgi:hypothetical protein